MADLSHSLPRAQVSATLSKKVSNGNGFAAKNVYDDVFGGPPKFGLPTFSSRIDDYSEIFGGYHASRGSTIPILDLPDLDESDFLIDVRNSKFDYSEVFGDSEAVDFAVPYEELFAEPGVESSSEDVWTPAETGSASEGSSEDPACSENNQVFSNGKSHHSYESVNQINTFYHKSNQMSKEDGISGTTHVTQLNAIPAFTLVVDEDIPTQKEKCAKSLHQVASDCNLNADACIGLTEGKDLRNINSHQATYDTVSRTCESNNPRLQRNPNGEENYPEKVFLSVSEINLRTQPFQGPPPSRPPPKLTIKQGESKRPIASNLSKSYAFEGASKDSSPTVFDVEVDASSSAAASAAAMKEAMEKAQARLKSAKVSLERKREGFHNHKRLGLKDDLRAKEKTESEIAHKAYRSVEEKSYRKFEDELNVFNGDERQQGRLTQVAPAFEVRTSLLNVSKESLDQMSVKEFSTNHEPHKQEEAGEQKAEKQLSEPVRMDKLKPIVAPPEQEIAGMKLMRGAKVYESQQTENRGAKMVFEQQEEKIRKFKAAKETCEREEHEKKVEVAEEVHQWEESNKKACAGVNVNVLEEHERRLKVAHEHVEHDMKLIQAREDQGYVNKVNGDCEQREPRKILKDAYEQEEHEKKQKQAFEQKKNEIEDNGASRWEENENSQRYANEREENGNRVETDREQEENEGMLNEIPELEVCKGKQQLAREREEDEKSLKEAFGHEEHDKRAKICRQEENKKRQKEAHGKEENLKKLEELEEEEENEKRLREVHEKKENEKRQKEASEEEDEKLKELQEKEENDKQQKEAHKREEREMKLKELQEQEENDKRPMEAHECKQIERGAEVGEREEKEKKIKRTLEQEENNKRQQEAHDQEENGKKVKAPQDSYVSKEEGENLNAVTDLYETDENKKKLNVSSEACILNEDNILKATCEAHGQGEENSKLRVAQEPCEHREGGQANRTGEHAFEQKENEKESEPAKGAIELEKNADLEVAHIILSASEREVVEERNKADSKLEFGCNEKKLQEINESTGHEEHEKNKNAKEITFDGEDKKKTWKAAQDVKQGVENGKKMEAAQPPHILEEKGDRSTIVNDVNMNQNVDVEGNLSKIPKKVECVKEERIEREKEQEKERLRKIEEDIEREREREKDRMAVERVTREARERAFAEARERAERAAVERATAEARQRALVEARERLEKASTEARQRAERAAVERATAEAQERAMEKAMAGKAALGAKEWVERSISEKFSATSRDSGMKHSTSFSDLQDSQFQSSGSFSGSQRYPDSSSHAFASEKSQGAEAESAQRCKSRLERHQRTVQRAAKALSEKNMRDLLAQREQAEKNRFAETLDADVKRWSSGKEGNLRALLSTLQYILGPESGWQPVPLTDVITAVAVKKAYRKATLCVHPDKLQQRGASIQQKYICEKVFDLLKEAWNKFNSEER